MLSRLKRMLTGGLSYILCGNFLSKAVALISGILIARLVDKNEYAYLSYADNLYSYISLFTGLGLASALLVVCTPDVSAGKQKTYLNKALWIGGSFELLAAAILCIGVQLLQVPFPEARRYMWLLVAYPLLTYLFTACQSFVRVKRENKRYAVLGAGHTILVSIFSIVFALAMDAIGVIPARYAAAAMVFVLAAGYLRRKDRAVVPEPISRQEEKEFLSTGLALMFANLFSGMMPINEAFIVNHLIKEEAVTANFKVAGIIPSMLPIITSSVMVYYFPIISAMKHDRTVKKTVRSVALINAAVIVCITAVGMALTPVGIRLLYGSKYLDAIALSYPLWIMRAVNAAWRMVPLNVLAAVGQSKFNAVIAVFTCLIHAVLDYVFISLWSMGGVAYAAIAVYVISGAILWLRLRRVYQKLS